MNETFYSQTILGCPIALPYDSEVTLIGRIEISLQESFVGVKILPLALLVCGKHGVQFYPFKDASHSK